MDSSRNRTILGLNILGVVSGVSAAIFLYVFFFIGNGQDGNYYLGSFFTSLIVAVLSFGFAYIIKLLGEMRDQLIKGE